MLGSAQSEKVMLISREIIFAEFQTYMTTVPRRYRQTGGQTTCLGNTVLCYASHCKNETHQRFDATGWMFCKNPVLAEK